MWLLIDIGNTRIKWCIAQAERIAEVHTITHGQTFDMTPLGAAWQTLAKPQRILISNVGAATVAQHIGHWSKTRWQLETEQFISPAQGFGITSAYATPEQLGSDRFATMVAAYQITQQAVMVVSCGTALTIDLVNAQGIHQGGYILPGLRMMQQSLGQNTAQLAELLPENPAHTQWQLIPGKDTQTCVAHGALLALSSVIERAYQQAQQTLGKVKCLLTGGDATNIQAALQNECQHEPDLVLRGLHIIATQSEENA